MTHRPGGCGVVVVGVMRVLDLFSGVGMFSYGLEKAGMATVAFCEVNEFCRRVLAKHWPDVPLLGDVTQINFYEGQADVICGGFPCQDVSRAGKRAGLAGERSGLYRELVRAIRVVRPKYAIVENVAALLGDGMGTVLGDLAESGGCLEWDCVPAEAFGAPHERDRVFIVADFTDTGSDWKREQTISGNIVGLGAECEAEKYSRDVANPARLGCGQGWPRRPADSFTRVRDEARRNAADPYSARLAFREGIGRDAWEERQAIERDAVEDGGQSIWPDEPALLGVDDDVPDRMDRVRALGNSLIWRVPYLIGRAIMEAHRDTCTD